MKIILENLNSSNTDNLLQNFVIFIPRIQQVIEQTGRRIFSVVYIEESWDFLVG
jgi:hypothetical protein